MNAASLYQKLVDLGVVLTPHGEDGLSVEGPRIVSEPLLSGLIHDAKQELRALATKSASQAAYSESATSRSPEPFVATPADHLLAIANEQYWANIEAGYYRYLTWPRAFPEPCLCCGGRYRHSIACEMMRSAGLGVENTSRRRR